MAAKIWIRIQLKSLGPDSFVPVVPDSKSGTRKTKRGHIKKGISYSE
jgi:hypothetical protein